MFTLTLTYLTAGFSSRRLACRLIELEILQQFGQRKYDMKEEDVYVSMLC